MSTTPVIGAARTGPWKVQPIDGDGPRLETGWGSGPCGIIPHTFRSE